MTAGLISKRNTSDEEMNFIHLALVQELNIYNQAHLTRESALKKVYVIEKTGQEMAALFELHGEIRGTVVCLIDLYNRSIPEQEFSLFKSLFQESMNILLGTFLTNLENISNIMGLISSPRLINQSEMIPGFIADNLGQMKVWATDYKLHTAKNSYDCKVYIVGNRKHTIEV